MDEMTVNVKESDTKGGGFVVSYDMVLRVMSFCFTLVVAIVAGLDYQTTNVPISISDNLPTFNISVTAKWHYLSSTVFLVVANSIACSYSFTSIVLSLISHNKKMKTQLPFLIFDLIMVALLFSANGAASAVGIIGLKGNSHTQWHKVCYVFKRYCHQGEASVVISFFGSFAFLGLVLFAILKLHKKCS